MSNIYAADINWGIYRLDTTPVYTHAGIIGAVAGDHHTTIAVEI